MAHAITCPLDASVTPPVELPYVVEEERIKKLFRIPERLNDLWKRVTESQNIGENDALIATLEFVLTQDHMTRAMIWKQVPADDLTLKLAEGLRKMQSPARPYTRAAAKPKPPTGDLS